MKIFLITLIYLVHILLSKCNGWGNTEISIINLSDR